METEEGVEEIKLVRVMPFRRNRGGMGQMEISNTKKGKLQATHIQEKLFEINKSDRWGEITLLLSLNEIEKIYKFAKEEAE